MDLVRLQKALADAGVASRRKSEELIAQGRVTVDGRKVTEMGVKVDPAAQDIRFDGVPVRPVEKVHYLLNKPAGVVCTTSDPGGKQTAVGLIPDAPDNAFTVGRLDTDTEGLVIVTNDGDLAQRVAHPSHGVPKVYHARVKGAMNESIPRALMKGVMLDNQRCRAKNAAIIGREPEATIVRVTMMEGRKREVRRMLAKLNHPVVHLRRVAIGPVVDETLKPGQWRPLTPLEIKRLLSVSKPRRPQQKDRQPRPRPSRKPR